MKVMKYVSVLVVVAGLLFINKNTFSQFNKITVNVWKGIASYYHPKFNGRKTSNGEVFSNEKLTCANNFLRLGTYILVSNIKNGKSVIVKVNDRMSPRNKRLIDLSQAAASKLGLLSQGVGEVKIQVLTDDEGTIAYN